jgi:hypothetical protein
MISSGGQDATMVVLGGLEAEPPDDGRGGEMKVLDQDRRRAAD